MTATLTMPKQYVVIENDEMEYIDGGAWSANTLRQNLQGLALRSARAFQALGISTTYLASVAKYTYATAVAKFGVKIVTAASIVGGIVGGLVAALAAGLAINHLGRNRVWY